MKHTRKWLEETADRLDLPGEIVAGLTKLELTGFSRLSVEGHRGIVEYSPEAVAVRVKAGTVRVEGSNLSIALMNHDFLVLAGKITAVNLAEDKDE